MANSVSSKLNFAIGNKTGAGRRRQAGVSTRRAVRRQEADIAARLHQDGNRLDIHAVADGIGPRRDDASGVPRRARGDPAS